MKRKLMVALVVILAIVVSVGSTVLFAYAMTGGIGDQMSREYVTAQVNRTGDVVNVTTASDAEAYIRTGIVVSWKNKNGKVLSTKPVEGEDYILTMDADAAWSSEHIWYRDPNTDFFYYKESVAAGDVTQDLIAAIEVLKKPADDCELFVEVYAQGIRVPTKEDNTPKSVAEAWSITAYN